MASMTIHVRLPVEIKPEDNVYVANCPILDVISQGSTPDEARHNIQEAVTLFIETCFEMGTLDEVLKECGFRPVEDPISGSEDLGEQVDVVLPFFAAKRLNECHA